MLWLLQAGLQDEGGWDATALKPEGASHLG